MFKQDKRRKIGPQPSAVSGLSHKEQGDQFNRPSRLGSFQSVSFLPLFCALFCFDFILSKEKHIFVLFLKSDIQFCAIFVLLQCFLFFPENKVDFSVGSVSILLFTIVLINILGKMKISTR